MKSKYTFQIRKGQDNLWYCTIVAANSQPVYTSEGYTQKQNALKSVRNLITWIKDASPELIEAAYNIEAGK